MSVNDRKVFVMALMLVALLSIFVSVASADTQKWYPSGTSDLMTKSIPAAGFQTLNDGVWQEWLAGPAECDLTMPAGTWKLHLDYYAGDTGFIGAKVWKDETHEYLNSKYTVYLTEGVDHSTIDVDLDGDPNSVDFTTGQHLSMEIAWFPDDDSSTLKVYCGAGRTTISSPSTDPGYPVPELSTLALFSVGLVALVGYVVYRRRKI